MTPSRLNARYQPALEVAELILAGRSLEDFVAVTLSEALKPYGGRASFQYPTHLDEGDLIDVRPDFVWLREGRPVIVDDAKYKSEKPAGFANADLCRLLAYTAPSWTFAAEKVGGAVVVGRA